MFSLLSFSLFLAAVSAFNWTQPDLGRPCEPGENGTAPGIKYYEDRHSYEMLPFFYHGCGGDYNRYDTSFQRMQDAMSCPGYPVNVGSCNSGRYHGEPKACPATAYCLEGFPFNGFGQCCDSATRDRAYRNRGVPECKAPRWTPVRQSNGYVLLGRNCTHNFCPEGSICHQGEFYGYCCLRAGN